MFAALAAAKERNGVSPYVLEVTRTAVRGLQPRSGLMSLCPYVLLFSALAAAKPRYGVSPLAHCHINILARMHKLATLYTFTM